MTAFGVNSTNSSSFSDYGKKIRSKAAERVRQPDTNAASKSQSKNPLQAAKQILINDSFTKLNRGRKGSASGPANSRVKMRHTGTYEIQSANEEAAMMSPDSLRVGEVFAGPSNQNAPLDNFAAISEKLREEVEHLQVSADGPGQVNEDVQLLLQSVKTLYAQTLNNADREEMDVTINNIAATLPGEAPGAPVQVGVENIEASYSSEVRFDLNIFAVANEIGQMRENAIVDDNVLEFGSGMNELLPSADENNDTKQYAPEAASDQGLNSLLLFSRVHHDGIPVGTSPSKLEENGMLLIELVGRAATRSVEAQKLNNPELTNNHHEGASGAQDDPFVDFFI